MPLLNPSLGGYMNGQRIRRIFKGAVAMIPGWVNLYLNPSMEATGANVEHRRNYVTDPRATAFFSTDGATLGWTSNRWFGGGSGAGTYSLVTGASDGPLPGITTYARKTWTVTGSGASDTGFETNRWTGFTAGTVYTVSGWVRSNRAWPATGFDIYWNDATGTVQRMNVSFNPLAANTWTRFSAVATAPSTGATLVRFVLDVEGGSAPVPGDVIEVTGLMVEAVGTVGTVSRTNLHTNPGVGRATTGWFSSAGGGTVTTTRETTMGTTTGSLPGGTGQPWFKIACTVTNTASPIGIDTNSNSAGTTNKVPVTASLAYSFGLYAVSSVNASATFRIIIQWWDAAGAAIGGPVSGANTSNTPLVWQRLTLLNQVAPAGAAYVSVSFRHSQTAGTWPVGGFIGATCAEVQQSTTLTSYFEGISTGVAATEFAWVGAPFASASVARNPPTGYVGTYFDGGLQQTPDSDLTNAWVGTANGSASTLTGASVASQGPTGAGNASRISSTQWAERGTKSVRVIPKALTNDSYVELAANGFGGLPAITAMQGKTYTVTATLRLTAPLTTSLNTLSRRLAVIHVTPGGNVTERSEPQVANVAGVYTMSLTFTVPMDSTYTTIRGYNGASVGGGDVWWDSVTIVEGSTALAYKDGTFPGWGWDGAANASSSSGWN